MRHSIPQSSSTLAVGTQKWINSFGTGEGNRIVRDLLSAETIEYIRNELNDPDRRHIKRAFQLTVIDFNPYRKAMAISDLLLKCRWEEVRSMDLKKKKMLLYDEMPPLSELDAKNFIKYGKDPVLAYIDKCNAAAAEIEREKTYHSQNID